MPGLNTAVSKPIQERSDRLYMVRGDMHFNVKGQALAAEGLGEYICSTGIYSWSENGGMVQADSRRKQYR